MQLTDKQEQGLKCVLTKYKNHDKFAVISGYAVWTKQENSS